MANKGKYYITTAIAYTSRKPHIGNSYEIVMTDALARYKRMQGYDVFFLTGTDEHGQKIEGYANAAGVTPKQYIQNKQLSRARDILNGDDCTSIHAVALSVGYDDALYFSRVFRAKYGQSPTAYLRSARHK